MPGPMSQEELAKFAAMYSPGAPAAPPVYAPTTGAFAPTPAEIARNPQLAPAPGLDLGLLRAPVAPQTINAPGILAEQATAMNQADADAKTGLRVAAINSFNAREAAKKAGPSAATPAAAGAVEAPAAGPAGAPVAAFPPAHLVPGGWQMQGKTVHEGIPVSEDVVRGVAAARMHEGNAADLGERSADQQASGQASQLGTMADELARREQDARAREDARAAKLDSERSRLAGLTEQYNAHADIDPGRFYAKSSTPSKILGILGVALSGFAAGLKGGQNQAISIIEHAVDQDIEAQKATAANLRGGLSDQRGLLAEMRTNFGDERQAEAAAKAAYLQRAGYELDKLAATSKSDEIKARAESLRAGIDSKYAELRDKFDERAANKVQHTERYAPPQMVGGLAATPHDNALFVGRPGGKAGEGYQAATLDEAKKGRALTQAVSALESVRNTAVKAREATNVAERAAGNLGVYKSDDYQSLKSSGKQALLKLKDAEQLGAISASDLDLAEGTVGDLTAATGNPIPAFDSYLAQKKKELQEFEQSQSAQGATRAIALDKHGRPVAVTQGQATLAAPTAMPAGFKAIYGAGPVATPGSPQRAAPVVVSDAHSKEQIEKLTAQRDFYQQQHRLASDQLEQVAPLPKPPPPAPRREAPLVPSDARLPYSPPNTSAPIPAPNLPPPFAAGSYGGWDEKQLRGLMHAGVGFTPMPNPAAAMPTVVTSDERSKTGVNPLHATMDGIEPVAFNYRDPERDGAGRRAGVIAQQLEATPMGRSIVHQDESGRKVIEGSGGLSLALAAAADQHRRLSALEKKR